MGPNGANSSLIFDHSSYTNLAFYNYIVSKMSKMPRYHGTRQTVEIKIDGGRKKETHDDAGVDSDDWAAQYQTYLDGNEFGIEMRGDRKTDVGDAEVEDWAVQYANHCEETEAEFFASRKTTEE